MKKSEIKHILSSASNNAPNDEPELVFTHYIYENGEEVKTEVDCCRPEHYDNVRHLSFNLYYAWDNGSETKGGVYVGKFK